MKKHYFISRVEIFIRGFKFKGLLKISTVTKSFKNLLWYHSMYSYSILYSKKDVSIALSYSLENTEGKITIEKK